MTKVEYKRIVAKLDALTRENLWVERGYTGAKAEGFRNGIQEAKTIVQEVYEKRSNKNE